MNTTKLYIKNMVCDRCILVVGQELEKLGFTPVSISLGEVQIQPVPGADQRGEINSALREVGFELIDDKKSKLINQIKTLVINLIHHPKSKSASTNISTYLSREIGRDYSYLSNLFSDVEGTTIEQYVIHVRIEKAKELLVYGEMNVSEIATQLGYSSVAHLSNQFKKITGLSPSHFKSIGASRRNSLDKL